MKYSEYSPRKPKPFNEQTLKQILFLMGLKHFYLYHQVHRGIFETSIRNAEFLKMFVVPNYNGPYLHTLAFH